MGLRKTDHFIESGWRFIVVRDYDYGDDQEWPMMKKNVVVMIPN